MKGLLILQDLLQHEVEDLYSAEEQIIEALPKMIKAASNRELKEALNDHLKVTKEQKKRLDKVLQFLKKENNGGENQSNFLERMFGMGTKCKGMEGLITEGEKMMGEDAAPAVMDAAIIGCAQKIEHYEIAGYGTARAYAEELGLTEIKKLLLSTLNEEYKADDSLTKLAIKKVNVKAEIGSERESQSSGGRKGNQANKGGSQSRPGALKTTKRKPAAKKGVSKSASKR